MCCACVFGNIFQWRNVNVNYYKQQQDWSFYQALEIDEAYAEMDSK